MQIKPPIVNPIQNLQRIKEYISVLSSKELREQIRNYEKREMRQRFPFKSTVPPYMSGGTIDIFPVDISFMYAYDLNWTPRPVPQSYSAYTSRLDNLNATFLEGDRSPKIILYAMDSFDDRYPLFDEPATFRTLLKNYQPVFNDGYFIFLKKRDKKIVSSESLVISKMATIGEEILIPEIQEEELLFAKIHMEYSRLGKLISFLYKPSVAYIQFSNINGTLGTRYRFVNMNADSGIHISPYVNSLEDLFKLWSGVSDKKNFLKKIIISTKNSYLYNPDIKVEFVKIKFI